MLWSSLIVWIAFGMKAAGIQVDGTRIEGLVLDGTTELPMPAVTVQIGGFRTSTDRDGRFAFNSVPPGRFTLLADRTGYLRAKPEGKKSGNDGNVLTIQKGQPLQSLTLRMFRGGSVAGRVFGSDGNPLQGMVVIPYRATYNTEGDPVLTRLSVSSSASPRESQWSTALGQQNSYSVNNVEAGTTNNSGEFRITNLEPGRYSFYLVPMFPNSAELPEYYPGVTNVADASIVEVNRGEELHLNNMTMVTNMPAKLRVQVLDETGQAGTTAFVQVFRKGGSEILFQWPILHKSENTSCEKDAAVCTEIGKFSVGVYEVEAVVYSGSNSFAASNRVPLQMSGDDVRLDVPVRAGTTVSGTATATRSGAVTPIVGLKLALHSNEAVPNVNFTLTSGIDGSFKMGSLPSGVYRVTAESGFPPGLCFDELRQDERNVFRAGVAATAPGISLNATFVESRNAIRGTVTDANGRSIGGATVVLIPDDRNRFEAFASAVADQNGAFEMSCLRLGAYHLFSWIEMEGYAYRNAEWMKRFEEQGQKVEVSAAGSQTMGVKLLPQ